MTIGYTLLPSLGGSLAQASASFNLTVSLKSLLFLVYHLANSRRESGPPPRCPER
jgi:hypothetical protein